MSTVNMKLLLCCFLFSILFCGSFDQVRANTLDDEEFGLDSNFDFDVEPVPIQLRKNVEDEDDFFLDEEDFVDATQAGVVGEGPEKTESTP